MFDKRSAVRSDGDNFRPVARACNTGQAPIFDPSPGGLGVDVLMVVPVTSNRDPLFASPAFQLGKGITLHRERARQLAGGCGRLVIDPGGP
jgi:hypothetical protein